MKTAKSSEAYPADYPVKINCLFSGMVPDIRPHPQNYNVHPDSQIKALVRLLKRHGVRAPIVADLLTNQIVKGHGLYLALTSLGCTQFPVSYQKFPDEKAAFEYMQSDNIVGQISQFDFDSMYKDSVFNIKEMDLGFADEDFLKTLELEEDLPPEDIIEDKPLKFAVTVQFKEVDSQVELFKELQERGFNAKMSN